MQSLQRRSGGASPPRRFERLRQSVILAKRERPKACFIRRSPSVNQISQVSSAVQPWAITQSAEDPPNRGNSNLANLPSMFLYAKLADQKEYFDFGDVSMLATINRANGAATGKITSVVFKTRLFQVGRTYHLRGTYAGNLYGPESRTVTGTNMASDWRVEGGYCQ